MKFKPYEEHTITDLHTLIMWGATRNGVLREEIEENESNIKKWKKRIREINMANRESMCEYLKCPNKAVCLHYCRKHHKKVCI